MSFIIQEQAAAGFDGALELDLKAGGQIDFYAGNQTQLFYVDAATSNYSLNITFSTGTNLAEVLNVDESVSLRFGSLNGASAHYLTGISIDGSRSGISYSWASAVPTSGLASSIMSYDIDIIKTSTTTYKIYASTVDYETAGEIPEPPTSVSAAISNNSACEVSFIDLNEDPNYPNTYIAFSTPSGISATGSASPITVSGLTPSATYSFQVYASNVFGDSGNSVSSNSVLMVQNAPSSVEILFVAGGGPGGSNAAEDFTGGGGAGGYFYSAGVAVSTATVYNLVVGTGGSPGSNGNDTTGFGRTAVGGGRGGSGNG
jgi:hypothetical protein